MRSDQIALQLWTVREPAARDLPGTLAAVATAGYRSVELAGLPPTPVPQLAAMLADSGLAVAGSHEAMERLRAAPDEIVDRLGRLGCPRMTVPAMPEQERDDAESVRKFAGELATFAERVGGQGLRVGYHNHSFEFAPLDGSTLWEILLADLPPEIEIELDVHWAAHGGSDPVAEIRRLGPRVRLLHMKDRVAGPPPHDAPPGDGELPFPEIVAAGRDAGVEWYIVEQDEPADPLVDIGRGFDYLRSLAG